jgi:hypothetical protein
MEPATPVAIWLLTNLVAPDAYQRIADAVSSRSSIKRLIKEVKGASGIRISPGYKRWLRDEATWIDLISRDEAAFERMVTRLVKSGTRVALRRVPQDRERAEKLVTATIAHFLPTLDPSTAVAISEMRSEQRHQEVLDRIDARERMGERLQSIPPSARELLAAEEEFRSLAERLVDGVVRNDPREIISLWYTERPRWLADAPGPILLAFALLAQSYGFRDWAGYLYEEVADLGLSPAIWYARAALEAHAVGKTERQVEMLRLARTAGGGDVVEFLAAAMDEEWEPAIAAVDEDEAVQDPLLGALYAVVVGNAEGADAEINVLSTVIVMHPDYTNARLRLAQLLLVRSRDPNTTSRERDLQRPSISPLRPVIFSDRGEERPVSLSSWQPRRRYSAINWTWLFAWVPHRLTVRQYRRRLRAQRCNSMLPRLRWHLGTTHWQSASPPQVPAFIMRSYKLRFMLWERPTHPKPPASTRSPGRWSSLNKTRSRSG